jgi:hypothetical protein
VVGPTVKSEGPGAEVLLSGLEIWNQLLESPEPGSKYKLSP